MKKRLISAVLMSALLLTMIAPASAATSEADQIISMAVAQAGKSGGDLGLSGDWCGKFVSWCAKQSGSSHVSKNITGAFTAIEYEVNNGLGEFYCFSDATTHETASYYSRTFYNYLKVYNKNGHKISASGLTRVHEVNRASFTPQKGDLIIFLWSSDYTDPQCSHVGFVREDYDGSGYVKTVEGNTSSANYRVGLLSRRYSDKQIVGFVRPNYSGASTSTPSTPQYFNCNVQINCVNGQTVNLYSTPGASTRVDYFSKGQSVTSTYGAKLSDGSTWYRVTVNSGGAAKNLWLKSESSKMTVKDLNASAPKPVTLSANTSSLSLDLSNKKSQSITLTLGGDVPEKCQLYCSVDNSDIVGSDWGSYESGFKVTAVITAKSVGTTTITYSAKDTSTGKTLATARVNVTVTAPSYTVTYDANGGRVSPANMKVTYGSNYGSLPTPTRTGYVFDGWYTAKSGGTRITASTKVSLTSNQTLYAHWVSASGITYSVRHYQEKLGGGYTLADTDTLTGTTGKSVTPPTKSYTGFRSPATQSATVDADGSTIISYYYDRNSYLLTLQAGTGVQSVSGGGTYRYGETVTVTAQLENGYERLSWSSPASNLSSSQQTYQFSMPASNVTLTASAQQQKDPCAGGHTWGAWATATPPTCTQAGLQRRICTACGEQETKTAEVLGHNYQLSGGFSVCTRCGDVKNSGTAGGLEHFKEIREYHNGTFGDVTSEAWYADNVALAYRLGLMNGRAANRFAPGSNVTLAEAITLAARIHSIYYHGEEQFETYDGGNWFDPYVNYARTNNICTENYSYDTPATREEFVHILVNALPEKELDKIPGKILNFADAGNIIYASDVELMCGTGIINGFNVDGAAYFKPDKTISRAEVAAIITRIVQPNLRLS